MKVREEIEKALEETDLNKWDKDMLIDFFDKVWIRFYEEGQDTTFDTIELRDFWFYLKVICLSKLVDWNNLKAIGILKGELDRNAKKYENRQYRVTMAKWGKVCI